MRHLSRDKQLALVESTEGRDHPHLHECARCRTDVEALRSVLREARSVDVPEPSPLFWDHLSAGVSARIAAGAGNSRVFKTPWRVLVPLSVGVAALVLAVAIDRGQMHRQAALVQPAPASGSIEAAVDTGGEDAEWSLLGQMAGEFDVDTLSDSLATSRGGAEDAVYELNDRERTELAALLGMELGQQRPGQ